MTGDAASGATTLLSIRNLSISFGGVRALQDVSLDITRGHICAVIGPNGAGKTTLLNCISRFNEWDAGAIALDGTDMTRIEPRRVVRLGIGRTIQNLALFPTMTVLENVLVGGHSTARVNPVLSMLAAPVVRASEARLRARAQWLLERAAARARGRSEGGRRLRPDWQARGARAGPHAVAAAAPVG